MLGLGIASSHAPALFRPKEVWPQIYAAIPNYTKASQPHTAKLETPEVIQGYIDRIDIAFGVLREQLEAYHPDVLVVLGDDQGDIFSKALMPAFCVYGGEELWGTLAVPYLDEEPEEQIIRLQGHPELANHIVNGLFKHGFDPAYSTELLPMGDPRRGASHAMIHPMPRLMPALDIPVVPIFMNEYFPPMPDGRRCWELGSALRNILNDWPGRVAIYASGGLSHDPVGPRAGWVDTALDHWFLERLAQGDHEAFTHLFAFDSDTLRGGTGELRAWIAAAAACDRPATVVEYIAAHHAKCGLGFAYWPMVEAR